VKDSRAAASLWRKPGFIWWRHFVAFSYGVHVPI